MLRRITKPVLISILSAVLLLPGLLYSFARSANPFVYYRVARAEFFATAGHLFPVHVGTVEYHPFRLGTELLIATMSRVTALPVETIQYFPLGAVFIILAYLALTKRVTGNLLLAYLVTFSIAFDGMMAQSYDTAFIWSGVQGITVLAILAVFLCLELHQIGPLIVLLVIFGGLFTLHIVPVFWIILLGCGLALLVLFRRVVTRKSQSKLTAPYYLILAFLVMELASDDSFYINVKHFARGGYAEDFLTVFLPSIFQKLFGQQVQGQYLFASPINPVTAWASLIKPVIVIIPIGIYFLIRGVKLVKLSPRRWPSLDPHTAMLLAITFVGVVHLLAYIVYGGIPSLRYVGLVYPIASVIALKKLEVKRVVIIGVVLLWCVVSAICTFFYLKDFPRTPSYDEVKPTYTWLQQYSPRSPSILTDLDTYGKLSVLASHDGAILRFRTYNVARYALLVEDDDPADNRAGFLQQDIDYIFTTAGPYEDNPVAEGMTWRVYEPLSWHKDALENNAAMIKVRDDGILTTFIALKEMPQRGSDAAGIRGPP